MAQLTALESAAIAISRTLRNQRILGEEYPTGSQTLF